VPTRRVATSPAERSTARCWLMFGTLQRRSLDSSVTERSPQASVSSTHRRLGSDSARAMAALRGRSTSLRGSVAPVTLEVSHYLRKDANCNRCVVQRGCLTPLSSSSPQHRVPRAPGVVRDLAAHSSHAWRAAPTLFCVDAGTSTADLARPATIVVSRAEAAASLPSR